MSYEQNHWLEASQEIASFLKKTKDITSIYLMKLNEPN
jgi:hypothetical protein